MHCKRSAISVYKWPASDYIVAKFDWNISFLSKQSWFGRESAFVHDLWKGHGLHLHGSWFNTFRNFPMQRYLYKKQNTVTDLRLWFFDYCNVATSKTTPTIAVTSRPVLWGHPDIKWQVTLRSVDNLEAWLTSCLITFKISYVRPGGTVERVPWGVSK